jgi:hypothetical protein
MTSEDWEDLACDSDLQSVEICDSAVITCSSEWCAQVVSKSIRQSKPHL